ncbi:unnamed protein product [Agarophyton chilense]
MEAFATVFQVSFGGSVELLTLCAAGAALSHLGHWNAKVSAALSNVFVAMLGTVQNAINHSHDGKTQASAQELWIPLCFSVIISLAMMVVAYPLSTMLARNKSEFTKRVIFMCIVLGNCNSMPLLIMQSLCDGYQPLRSNEQCFMKATAYGTLYISFVTFLGAAQAMNQEEQSLLGETYPSPPKEAKLDTRTILKQCLLSPPTVAMAVTGLLACIPGVANEFLKENGTLRPVMDSFAMVGSIAVPLSSVIVGGDLYEALTAPKTNGDSRRRFGRNAIFAICMVRLVLFPFLGRWVYKLVGLRDFIADDELGAFILVQFGVLTANNAMIIANLLEDTLPDHVDGVRLDVAKCLFVQYLLAPILVTINTAFALEIQYS